MTAAWERLRAHPCARDLDDIRCEAGWVELLDVCFTALDALTPLPRVESVKQKFGELRIYYASASPAAQAVIAAARERALVTCALCGEAGRPCFREMQARVLCARDAQERGYVPLTTAVGEVPPAFQWVIGWGG